MKVLLLIPPFTQLNTPYPSTAYLKSFLESEGISCEQKDLGLDLILKLFSKNGLSDIKDIILKSKSLHSEKILFFLEAFEDYKKTIPYVIHFLQGNDSSLAVRIANRAFLPEGPRFLPLLEHPQILESFGNMGVQDKAKYLCSLYLDDIADIISESIDPLFEFSKYGEKIASSQNDFSILIKHISSSSTLIAHYLYEIIDQYIKEISPDMIGWSIPFPGNLLSALIGASHIKKNYPQMIQVMGGGYVNTELREIQDARFFNYIDYLMFDDGEFPLLMLIKQIKNSDNKIELVRTLSLNAKTHRIESSTSNTKNIPFKETLAPNYDGLNFNNYLSMLELPNPMHRMWSDYKWNKLILAHGCYWKKCTFCDTSLDYINRFEPQTADQALNKMIKIAKQTGSTGFHFVDEAAPPALLKSLSKKIIESEHMFSWWGNIRFDPYFTKDITELMSQAGCVAVTGGLEVASPRLLKLINKGVQLEDVARVAHSFKKSNIYVHAYLMYGFPSQTTQETIDSLEVVRQLFDNECLDSAFWHRFVATVHSPVGKNPNAFGVKTFPPESNPHFFAINEIPFFDPTNVDHDSLGVGLRKALYNFMHGIGLKEDVRTWFDLNVPKTQIKKTYISKILKSQKD